MTGIIDEKYKGYKGAQDWLAGFIADRAVKTKQVEKTVKEGDTEKKVKETRPDGIDIDVLFKLAEANGLDVDKYRSQRDSHGFPGRFRMTVRNMLQATIKRRHGLFDVNGKWVAAPADWLTEKGAPESPTETRKGEKIAPKADKANKAAEAA